MVLDLEVVDDVETGYTEPSSTTRLHSHAQPQVSWMTMFTCSLRWRLKFKYTSTSQQIKHVCDRFFQSNTHSLHKLLQERRSK